MIRKIRRGATESDALVIFVMLFFCYLFGMLVGWRFGYDDGAKCHADGKCVVVDLPDGRRTVCEVKGAAVP